MQKHHPKNVRIKRKYAIWLKEAKRKAPHSVDQAMAAINLFEASTGYKDFAAFHIEQARKFKADQLEKLQQNTGKPLAKATVKSRLEAVKAFFLWLADVQGYRAKIRYADCEYFNMAANDVRIASASREKPSPDLAHVHIALDAMPSETPIQKRDRAILAFALLTGSRDDAMASLSIGDVDLIQRKVFFDARHVRTKNRKSFDTWFFPVGGNAETILGEWIGFLKTELHFTANDPLFPKTLIGLDGNGLFVAIGLKREHWKNADAIRKVFEEAFTAVGMHPYNPHSIRKTLVRFGETVCKSPEEFKAWSQNLAHEDVMTTFRSYGEVAPKRQAQILAELGSAKPDATTDPMAMMEAAIAAMKAGKAV